jgi:hypothetical protein
MRVKNKEIRRRRHRKEQVMKAAAREIRAQYSGEKEPVKKAVAPAKKAPAKKKAE